MLHDASKGRYDREKAIEIRDAARASIGSRMPAKSLELKHTIRRIGELDAEIEEIEKEISSLMDEIQSPITSIPGMGIRMGAMILAEIGEMQEKQEKREKQQQGRNRQSSTRITDSYASVGGGGRSVVIGGPLISETKKQTRLLEGIGANTKRPPTVQVTGNVDAVISR